MADPTKPRLQGAWERASYVNATCRLICHVSAAFSSLTSLSGRHSRMHVIGHSLLSFFRVFALAFAFPFANPVRVLVLAIILELK